MVAANFDINFGATSFVQAAVQDFYAACIHVLILLQHCSVHEFTAKYQDL